MCIVLFWLETAAWHIWKQNWWEQRRPSQLVQVVDRPIQNNEHKDAKTRNADLWVHRKQLFFKWKTVNLSSI